VKQKGIVVHGNARWWAVALAVSACAACSSSDDAQSNADKSAEALSGELAQARAAGVDQSQLDVLAATSIAFEQYKSSMDRALDCMRESGLQVVNSDVVRSNGQDIINYSVGAGTVAEDQAQAVQADCYKRFAQYVDEYWQTSTPQGLAYEERRAAALSDPLSSCLDSYGVDVAADASFHDLVVAASKHAQAKQDEDCLSDVSYSTWEG